MIYLIAFLYISGLVFVFISMSMDETHKVVISNGEDAGRRIITSVFWFALPWIVIIRNL